MGNFIKKRSSTQGLYPEGFEPIDGCADSTAAAEWCYVSQFLTLALKRFSFPILVCAMPKMPFLISKALDISFEDNFEFDQFSVVRYRSRRDLLNICEEARQRLPDLVVYKEASLERDINFL